MKLWLLIALVLTIQEGFSVLATLVRASELHYSFWIISLVWLVVTILQIALGYYLGKFIQKKSKGSRFERWAEKYARKLEKSISKSGEKLALVIFSSAVSPGIGAFLASWLDISFADIFIYSLLGDLFWYLSTLATVFGVVALLSKARFGLIILICIVVVILLISYFRKAKTS
jgi:membrane protein YqaA with SNARE-associated domain